MDKQTLFNKTDAVINETRSAILTIFNALNQGQQKKILKEEEVKTIFDRYGIEY